MIPLIKYVMSLEQWITMDESVVVKRGDGHNGYAWLTVSTSVVFVMMDTTAPMLLAPKPALAQPSTLLPAPEPMSILPAPVPLHMQAYLLKEVTQCAAHAIDVASLPLYFFHLPPPPAPITLKISPPRWLEPVLNKPPPFNSPDVKKYWIKIALRDDHI